MLRKSFVHYNGEMSNVGYFEICGFHGDEISSRGLGCYLAAVKFSETSLSYKNNTRRQNPEDRLEFGILHLLLRSSTVLEDLCPSYMSYVRFRNRNYFPGWNN
jgi:hypothetical protein